MSGAKRDTLDFFPFDVNAFEAISRSDSDPEAAKKALLIAAKYIRDGKPLPRCLANYLANAIENAINSPLKSDLYNSDVGRALLVNLRLKANNRRPVKADWFEVGQRFDELIENGESQNGAASQISVEYDISESTAVRLWKEYRAAREDHDEIIRQEINSS